MCFPGLAGLHCVFPEQVQLQEHSCDPCWVSRNLGDPILREGTSHFPLDLKQVGCKPGAVGAMLSSQRETDCTSAFLPPFLKQNKKTKKSRKKNGRRIALFFSPNLGLISRACGCIFILCFPFPSTPRINYAQTPLKIHSQAQIQERRC